jgi:hypothetical protein
MSKGIDCATTITATIAAKLKTLGYGFIGRYLTGNYATTKAEAQAISDAGLCVVSLFEIGSTASYLTKAQGIIDCKAAVAAAQTLGQPINTPIYFCVDFDATEDEIKSNVVPYFQGIIAAGRLSEAGYKLGVYGSERVCQYIKGSNTDRYAFVAAAASGWRGNKNYDFSGDLTQASIDKSVVTISADLDTSTGSGGGWKI